MSAIDLSLRPNPAMLSEARAALANLDLAPGMLDDLRLIVSELVSNSLRHSGTDEDGSIDITIDATPEMVRGSVTDSGNGFVPPEPQQSMHRESGWGLFLVRQLATRWGVRSERGRTTVWFELDC